MQAGANFITSTCLQTSISLSGRFFSELLHRQIVKDITGKPCTFVSTPSHYSLNKHCTYLLNIRIKELSILGTYSSVCDKKCKYVAVNLNISFRRRLCKDKINRIYLYISVKTCRFSMSIYFSIIDMCCRNISLNKSKFSFSIIKIIDSQNSYYVNLLLFTFTFSTRRNL